MLNAELVRQMFSSVDNTDKLMAVMLLNGCDLESEFTYAEAKEIIRLLLNFCNNYRYKGLVSDPILRTSLKLTWKLPFWRISYVCTKPHVNMGVYKDDMKEYNKYHKLSAYKKIKYIVKKILEIPLD